MTAQELFNLFPAAQKGALDRVPEAKSVLTKDAELEQFLTHFFGASIEEVANNARMGLIRGIEQGQDPLTIVVAAYIAGAYTTVQTLAETYGLRPSSPTARAEAPTTA